jgi:hypothetical protein
VPMVSGAAAQVFVVGLYVALCWVAPISSTRPSCNRREAPSSYFQNARRNL